MARGISASSIISAAYLELVSCFAQEIESTIVAAIGFQSGARGTGSQRWHDGALPVQLLFARYEVSTCNVLCSANLQREARGVFF